MILGRLGATPATSAAASAGEAPPDGFGALFCENGFPYKSARFCREEAISAKSILNTSARLTQINDFCEE